MKKKRRSIEINIFKLVFYSIKITKIRINIQIKIFFNHFEKEHKTKKLIKFQQNEGNLKLIESKNHFFFIIFMINK